MADTPPPSADITELHEKFRKVKHDINNTLAVIMALSELGQRNPTYLEKLAKAVLQRGPEVVELLQGFQASLNEKMQLPKSDQSSSGVL